MTKFCEAEIIFGCDSKTCGKPMPCEDHKIKKDVSVPDCAACHGAFPGHQPGCPFGYDAPE